MMWVSKTVATCIFLWYVKAVHGIEIPSLSVSNCLNWNPTKIVVNGKRPTDMEYAHLIPFLLGHPLSLMY